MRIEVDLPEVKTQIPCLIAFQSLTSCFCTPLVLFHFCLPLLLRYKEANGDTHMQDMRITAYVQSQKVPQRSAVEVKQINQEPRQTKGNKAQYRKEKEEANKSTHSSK